jgi:hypothetical protein
MAQTTTQPDRLTETQLRCPHCTVPRFLVGLTGEMHGTIRVPCAKCRKATVFDLETGGKLEFVNLRQFERELRCGACRGFLAGAVATGEGAIRIPCTEKACKRNNAFKVAAQSEPVIVEVPVA